MVFRHLGAELRRVLVNGAPGVATFVNREPFALLGFTVAHRKIVEMNILADPDRLRSLDLGFVSS
jgi:RNA polymerase sigma-70 factor (ECF subfamily)